MLEKPQLSITREEADIRGLVASLDPTSIGGDNAARRMLGEIVLDPKAGLSPEVLELIRKALASFL